MATSGTLLLERLRATLNENTPDLTGAKSLLTQLKISLTGQALLTAQATPEQQLLSRETLELGAKWALLSENVEAFERYYAQLRPYYTDFRQALPASNAESILTGLHLLALLTQNRIAEFHLFLESLSSTQISEDPHIQYVVRLEQALMEGAYTRVLSHRENIPCPEYGFFLGLLEDTVREEIALCAEKSYSDLSLADTAELLSFKNAADVSAFASEHSWRVDPATQRIRFGKQEEEESGIPARDIIQKVVGYAQELESIV